MQTTRILQNKNLYCIFTKFIYKEKKKNNTHINNNNKKGTYKQFKTKLNSPTLHPVH